MEDEAVDIPKGINFAAWVSLVTIMAVAGSCAAGPVLVPAKVNVHDLRGACRYQAHAMVEQHN